MPSAKVPAKADREAADALAFVGAGFAAFDPAPIGRTGFATRGNFNAFDARSDEAFETGFPVCRVVALLLDLLAAGLPVFEGVALAAFVAPARVALATEALGDFSCVFLDIRLPFVAFRGSIIGVLKQAGIKPIAGQA